MRSNAVHDKERFADRYVLSERLHTGATTEVWLAHDTRADISVALKILDANAAERDATQAAFEQEWHIARALNHPHTVRGLGWHPGARPAYAMQYIDGTDFGDLCKQPLTVWGPPLLVMIDTLIYWHRKGVVHGDIKPSNLLLNRQGVAYLADYGAATIVDDASANTPRDAGTAAYASPERADGAPLAASDDVYAIGRVMVELATGDPDSRERGDLPLAIVELLRRVFQPVALRPPMTAVRDALAQASIERGQVDLQQLNIAVRRPAAVIASGKPPLTPLPHGAFENAPAPKTDEADGVSIRQLMIGLGVIAVFAVIFTLALRWLAADSDNVGQPVVTQQTGTPEPVEPEVVPEDPVTPVLSEQDRLEARAQSEEILGQLLSVLKVLEQRAADQWAGAAYEQGIAVYERGDTAYLAADYAQATARYNESLALLRPLTEQVNDVFEQAMRDGDQALLDENSVVAIQAFKLALAITPGDELATAGLARAENLDEVLQQMALGDIAERDGDLNTARAAYQQALTLDAEWLPAQTALTRIDDALTGIEFQQTMSRGFQALDDGQFAVATAAFESARLLRPSDRGPQDGLTQVRLAQRLERINGLMESGANLESEEAWTDALERYEAVLEIDGSLDPARQGVSRVRSRIALRDRATRILTNTDQLSDTQTLRDTAALLTQMEALTPRGPALTAQIDALTTALTVAAVPRPVVLQSDGQTNVDVLRVERLGTFQQKELRLRPGVYTAVGRRRGYVDKRVQFRVAADQPVPTIIVACDTPI
ncbi:MAG: serine/threonine-protein kinase [Pseudomonadota bacterium]